MKKNIKLFVGILIGIIISAVVGVSASILYQADEIGFTPSDPNWNVNNLESALNDLYNNKGATPELLWTNPDPTSSFSAQTINMDLSDYKYIIVIINDQTGNSFHSTGIVPIGEDIPSVGIGRVGGSASLRHFSATSDSIIIGPGKYGGTTYNTECVPYKIYGVKQDLGLDLGLE